MDQPDTATWVRLEPRLEYLNGERITLKTNGPDNPSCPVCGHYNAMLFEDTIFEDEHDIGYRLTCRDCATEVRIITKTKVQKKNFIEGRFPGSRADSSAMRKLLGLKYGCHLPAEGMPERLVKGVRVYVKPIPEGGNARRGHRVTIICGTCSVHFSAGRGHQHKCKTTD